MFNCEHCIWWPLTWSSRKSEVIKIRSDKCESSQEAVMEISDKLAGEESGKWPQCI